MDASPSLHRTHPRRRGRRRPRRSVRRDRRHDRAVRRTGTSIPPAGTPTAGGTARAPTAPAPTKPAKPRKRRRTASRPVLTNFEATTRRFFDLGRPARVVFRIDGRSKTVRVKLQVRRAGKTIRTIDLGDRATRRTHSVALTGREGGRLPEGALQLRLTARDRRGRGLRASSRASTTDSLAFYWHRFPLDRPVPVRRRGRALRRRPARPRAPGPGPDRGRGHAGRRPARGHRQERRVPGRRRRPLRRARGRRREPLVRLHAPARGLDPRARGRPRRDRRSAWPTSARPAPRPGLTCTSRSGPAPGTAAGTRSTRCRSSRWDPGRSLLDLQLRVAAHAVGRRRDPRRQVTDRAREELAAQRAAAALGREDLLGDRLAVRDATNEARTSGNSSGFSSAAAIACASGSVSRRARRS